MLHFGGGEGGGGYVFTDGVIQLVRYRFVNPIVPSYDYHSVVWGEWIECGQSLWCTSESFRLVKEQ